MTDPDYEKLKIIMKDYEIIKRESLEHQKLQLQTYPLALGAISLIFGYVLINGKDEALLVLPFITLLLAYRWIWDARLLSVNQRFLLKIENEKIPRLFQSHEKTDADSPMLLESQTFYQDHRSNQWITWLISAFLLLGIPTVISVGYHFLKFIENPFLLDQMPHQIYFLALISYTLLILGLCYVGYSAWKEWRITEDEYRVLKKVKSNGK